MKMKSMTRALLISIIACIFLGCKKEYLGIEESLGHFTYLIEGKWLQQSQYFIPKDTLDTPVLKSSNLKVYEFYDNQYESIIKRSSVRIFNFIHSSDTIEATADFYVIPDLNGVHLKIENSDGFIEVVDTAFFKTKNTLILKTETENSLITSTYSRLH